MIANRCKHVDFHLKNGTLTVTMLKVVWTDNHIIIVLEAGDSSICSQTTKTWYQESWVGRRATCPDKCLMLKTWGW